MKKTPQLNGVLVWTGYGPYAYTQDVRGDDGLQSAVQTSIDELRSTVESEGEDFELNEVEFYHTGIKTGVEMAAYNFPPKG
jgi:hypothetical protein